ncbi:hypothetical protein EVAR_66391_1 [Eumeta japonica]|uniref:Uncharacterized protein n=1 Tax=Eumeta variegata TaxID=151549 RepID=A0A4C1ZZM4_EUMVA|nr:hypothetical protein EVAR_66391_1 [Eumeta japonica]
MGEIYGPEGIRGGGVLILRLRIHRYSVRKRPALDAKKQSSRLYTRPSACVRVGRLRYWALGDVSKH